MSNESDNVYSVHSSSTRERGAWTISSASTPAQTVSSGQSVPQLAMPIVDLTEHDSSIHTVEYVESSKTPRSDSSISSEALDIIEAREVEARLASEAAQRAMEAAAARRRLLEARAKSAKSSRRSTTSRASEQHRQVMTDHLPAAVAPNRHEAPAPEHRPSLPELQPASRAQDSGRGVWDFLFPSEERHDPPLQNEDLPGDRQGAQTRAGPDDQRREEKIEEQLNILKKKIKQLENENGKGEHHHRPHPTPIASETSEPKSVYLTPRQTIGDLIDLNSPPKAKPAHSENRHVPSLPGPGLHQHHLDDLHIGPDHRHSDLLMNLPDMPCVNVQETMTNPPGLPPPRVSTCSPPSESNMVVQKHIPKTKIKEADTIKLLPLPDVPQFEAWKNNLRSQVMAASGRRDEAFHWILEVEDEQFTYDDLADCTDFETLDSKLSAAIGIVAKGSIGRLLTRKMKTAAKNKTILSSRQLLKLIYKQYDLDAEKGQVHDMEDLIKMTYPGDDYLELFLLTWEEMVESMDEDPGEKTLGHILFSLIEHSQLLKTEISRYNMASRGSYERSYDFLMAAITTRIEKDRSNSNRAAMVKARSKLPGQRPRTAMASVEDGGHEATSTTEIAAPAKPPTRTSSAPTRPQLSPEEQRKLKEKRATIPCRGFAKGQCRFGDRCQYLHARDMADKSDHATAKTGACTEIHETEDHGFDYISFSLAAARPNADHRVHEWVIDTGSENHLINHKNIDPDSDDIFPLDRPLRLATANGEISVNQRIKHEVNGLDMTVDPLILNNTVDAISVGRLVMDGDFSFHWPHGESAYFVKESSGRVTRCQTRGYVPILPADYELGDRALPGIHAEGHDQGEEHEQHVSATDKMKAQAASAEHAITHRPKNPYCWVCSRSKMCSAYALRCDPANRSIQPTHFGHLICADHIIVGHADDAGLDGERAGLIIMDAYTRMIAFIPVKDKTAPEAIRALKYFVGEAVVRYLYTDNSLELASAANTLGWTHPTSTPYRPQNNSLIERQVRTMVEGTRAALLQSGLPHRFWPLAATHQAVATSLVTAPGGDESPWKKKNGSDFPGMILPFGALVYFLPPHSHRDDLPKFGPNTVAGIFVGWHLEPGYGFRGDYLVIPISAFQNSLSQKIFKALRVKELVNFEATNFPLQTIMERAMLKTDRVSEEGTEVWPEEQTTKETDDSEGSIPHIDQLYLEAFGVTPSRTKTFNEKYDEIARDLFGDDLEDAHVQFDAPEEAPVEKSVNHELEGGETPEDCEAENHRMENLETNTSRCAPRARRVYTPSRKDQSATSSIPAISWTTDPGAMLDRGYLSMMAKTTQVDSPVPGRILTVPSDRKLIEFCCGANSRLGDTKFQLDGCIVIRLTLEHDLTTNEGMEFAMKAIKDTPRGMYLHLWGSIPCTAGSPWQHINKHRPNAVEKMNEHLKTFHKLITNFRVVAREVRERGGDVSFEWPTQCSLWGDHEVVEMLEELSLNQVHLHGCAAGLQDDAGVPVKKPWTIATTSPSIVNNLGKFLCPGPDRHPIHSPCAGKLTKASENYTDDMVKSVHRAVKEEALDRRARMAMTVAQATYEEYAGKDAETNIRDGDHRPKQGTDPLWCTMITKTLGPKDPQRHHPKAKAAIKEELDDLRSVPTWDEENVLEGADAAKQFPEAHFARLFAIVGIKNFEQSDVALHRWKGRIVLSGDAIKTSTGDWAMFAEIGSVPSTMAACRALLAAYCLTEDAVLLQSDCVRAYVQAHLKGPPTFVRLPREWWPVEWSKFKDPVCRLIRAIYGHPHSGDFWHDKLKDELVRLGFTTIEGWPSVFKLVLDQTHVMVFVVYVDDLLMMGTPKIMGIIDQLRVNIKMEDPKDMGKYLGCLHHVSSRKVNGDRITEVSFDMREYFRSAVEQFVEITGKKLTPAASPHAPRLSPEETEKLIAQKGEFAQHAASFLMKLMYGTRMALPSLSVVISRLASQITKWTAESDRRLLRVYAYLQGSLDVTLSGSLAVSDRQGIRLVAWPDADLNGCYLTTKSTSGFFLELVGADGRSFPLNWGSKRQGGTAQHTAEAEVVSLASCLRSELIPMQSLLQQILQMAIPGDLMEDNNATIIAVNKGYSPAMRYLARTQRTALGLVHDVITEELNPGEGKISVLKADTVSHKGDMFTKELDPRAFLNALNMIRLTKIVTEEKKKDE